MGITPKDPADFDPTMGDYHDLRPFRFWCQKVLPLVYDDSLSYYEILNKVVDYLNKTMEDVGVLHDDVDALHTAYQQLQNYVNDYFSTLNVQQEINNKLDIMAADGTLDALLLPYFNAYKTEINNIVANQNTHIDEELNTQNQHITVLESRMDSFAHLAEGSTTGDAELMDIRVAGNGHTYPSAGDAVREQFDFVKNEIDIMSAIEFDVAGNGYYEYLSGQLLPTNDYRYSEPIPIKKGVTYTLISENYTAVSAISLCDEDGTNVVPTVPGLYDGANVYTTVSYKATSDGYCIICYKNTLPPSFNALERLDDLRSDVDSAVSLVDDIYNSVQAFDEMTNLPFTVKGVGIVEYDSGEIVQIANYRYTNPIALLANVEYTFKSVNYTNVAAISVCDENGNNIVPVVRGQYDGEGVYTTVTYTPNKDCYVMLSYHDGYNPVFSVIRRLDDIISDIGTNTNNLEIVNTTLENNGERTSGRNKFNPATSSKGYLDTDGETLIQVGDWYTTDFIDVSNFAFCFTSVDRDGVRTALPMYFMCIYDENKDFIAQFNTQQNPYQILDYVKYLRFSYHRDTDLFIQTENNTTFSDYSPYKEYYMLGDNTWRSMKWACMGDSLTEHNYRTKLNYHDYVSMLTGINVINLGVSGSGYMSNAGHRFYERVDDIPTDSDVVTIFGSVNDLSFTLGNPTDTGTSTICGCINTTIDNIVARMPRVSLGIVAPTPCKEYPPSNTTNAMALYVEALRTICANRSIPFLDLYHESNLRPWTSEGRAACYSKDDGNGTHPDEYGHKLIAPRFKNFLDGLIM